MNTSLAPARCTEQEVEAQVLALRMELLGFARVRLRNDAWAEDAVSETMLVALERPGAFLGASQVRSWLTGILKHKLVDQVRRHTRESNSGSGENGVDPAESITPENGDWRAPPDAWSDGPAAVQQRQFLGILDECHKCLPPLQRRAFIMRECMDLDTEEICRELNITPEYFFVVMHRVRARLRHCLQIHCGP
jgi:RNA polymerase sigma-70 factor (TIGR02943 family)